MYKLTVACVWSELGRLNERPFPQHREDQDVAVPSSGNNVLSHFTVHGTITRKTSRIKALPPSGQGYRETGTNNVFLGGVVHGAE